MSDHLKVALSLSLKEFKWLSQLPYYIKSIDLGTLFVHAGFQTGVRLSDQEPWIMMTMRSYLPEGRVSHRCYYKFPWAETWEGPLTVLFGHDAARGLQEYRNAIGLDTGCVYGGRLSCVLLPDKEIVSVPARRVYTDYVKSRNHKLYALSQEMAKREMMTAYNESSVVDDDTDENEAFTSDGGDLLEEVA